MIAGLLALLLAAPPRPPLPAEAVEPLRRGILAADARAWSLAREAFAEAVVAAPEHPVAMRNLGLVHAQLGHHAAAAAWFYASLAAAPKARDDDIVVREAERLLAAADAQARGLVAQAQEIHGELLGAGVRPGIRGLATAAALQAMRAEDVAGAEAALGAIEDVTQRDAAWEEIARALGARSEERAMARAAAQRISDTGRRAPLLAELAPPAEVATGVAAWRMLATELSRDAGPHDPVAAIAALGKPTDRELTQLPLRLLQIAAGVSGDALRVRKLARTQ